METIKGWSNVDVVQTFLNLRFNYCLNEDAVFLMIASTKIGYFQMEPIMPGAQHMRSPSTTRSRPEAFAS